MNYALDDVQRSLRRFVANALGSPPWRVRSQREVVADDERPVAVVEPTAAAAPVPGGYRTSVPQGDVQMMQPFVAQMYPALGATPRESRAAANAAAQAVDDAVVFGLVVDEPVPATPATPATPPYPATPATPAVPPAWAAPFPATPPPPDPPRPRNPAGGPFRIPIFDFDGVPLKGPGRAGPAVPYGYAWVDAHSVRAIQDALDFRRYTVACDLRLTWWRGGRLPPPAPLVQEIYPTGAMR